MSRRQRVYFGIRAAAALTFVLAALALPRGVPAGLLVVAAGLAAVLSCIGTNAGGPGETAGARPQDRYFDSVRAPQGQWPPYAAGSLPDGDRSRATPDGSAAS